MLEPAPELPESDSIRDQIVYEQPLNERMRTFLRLEFLFRQARHHLAGRSIWETRATLASFIDVLALLNRGDARNEVLKEIERHTTGLQRYDTQPGVDRTRLRSVLDSLARLREGLNNAGKHFTQDLRDCEFLSAIRHRSAIPGGTCMFDLPDYGYWLHLPPAERRRQLEDWTSRLRPICDAVAEVLWLTREATLATDHVAPGGLFQHGFDRTETPSLVRVQLPANAGLFPEISAGQHRFTIRFVRWRGVDARPVQVNQDVRFQLAIC